MEKTAYELRSGDCSSDVCSSDLCSVFEAISHHRWISGLAQGAAIHVPVSDRTISYGLAGGGTWFADRPWTSVDAVTPPVSAKLFRAASDRTRVVLGNALVSTCRSRGSPSTYYKNSKTKEP